MLSNSISFPLAVWRVLILGIHSWSSKNLHGNIRTGLKARREKWEESGTEEKRGGTSMCFFFKY